ncbi:MAG: carboxypeptidase-like regulatory domain-containing protein [Gemmatimonas sp.]|uniref:carboxypeptidase-like regulatory domain-containing protein n=1 Tax=Gemmatimonas sp. TaxID=1962908 RepID=UPI00391FC6B4
MPLHPLPSRWLALALTVAMPLGAQNAEVVRGRVLDDSARALVGVVVSITRGPDRLVQQTTTDSAGRYSSRFDPGTGDYLVSVSALGFRSARRRVERVGTERELVADFTMARDMAAVLAAVNIRANRAVRAEAQVASAFQREVGASETYDQGVQGRVSPNAAGNLNAIAGTMPGVTMTPSGPSILGAPASSNLTTLNGMALPGGSLPRAARADVRVSGATFDATRGGFAGANIDVRLGAGDRNYQNRNSYLTLNAPQLQATDAVGRSLGLTTGGFRASVGADGEAIRRALTYNVALDAGRTVSDPATLLSSNAGALRRAGLSPDSAQRAQTVAAGIGLPLAGGGIPTQRVQQNITWLGRLDDVRDTLRTLTLTSYVANSNEGALGFGPLTSPSAGGRQSQQTMGVQFVHSQYVGAGYTTLMENRLAASRVREQVTPYRLLPGATVLARSSSDAATSDVVPLQLGGNPFLDTDDTRWTLEGANEMVWNARGRTHRFKTSVWGRADGLTQQGQPNALGAYTFMSIADLQANRPAAYTRTITQPVRQATSFNGALAFSHQWNPSRWLSVISGARLEGNAFGDAPPANATLEQALGVRSGVSPRALHVSPRVGFSYTYSRSRENDNGQMVTNTGSWYRNTMGIIRGGIGEFRDLYRPGTLADAMVNAGLPGGTLALACVGSAVPVPDWTAYANGAAVIPAACADGSGALAERAPSVTLVDPSFDVPRSWRASLGWATSTKGWMLKVDGLASYDLSQPSTLDANFSGASRFVLAGEGNRPMFVSPASIDVASGAVTARASRRRADFGRVALRTSDLRGYGTQLTTTLQPDLFRGRRGPPPLMFSLGYTIQQVRQQFRGADGGNFGDPFTKEWASGMNDARHALVAQAGIGIPKVGTLTLFTRLQSGTPFTPLVRGDLDGDGRPNDRAFVPSAATEPDAALRTQMQALLASAPGNVRRCLEAQGGIVAGRMSCRGPWTQQMNLMLQPNVGRIRGRRTQLNVVFENPLAGPDQLLHGESGLRGWGSQAMPDPVLLLPRGFDAAAQRFRYDVNPRFGDTRAFRTLSRIPFRVVVDVQMDLSVPYDLQTLRRALEPVKQRDKDTKRVTWTRRGADSIAALYLSRTSNLHRLLLAESDSLFLTKEQIGALLKADSVYSARVRDLYLPLARFLAEQKDGVAGKAALDSVQATTKRYWPLFWEQVDIVQPIVQPQQRELLPLLANISATTTEQRKNSQWQFGYPVPLTHNRPRVGGDPGGPGQTSISRDSP